LHIIKWELFYIEGDNYVSQDTKHYIGLYADSFLEKKWRNLGTEYFWTKFVGTREINNFSMDVLFWSLHGSQKEVDIKGCEQKDES